MEQIKGIIKKTFHPYFYGKTIYTYTSRFNSIKVVDKRGYRYLIFDDPAFANKYPEEIYQGCIFLKDPVKTRVAYSSYFHFSFFLKPAIRSILMIGLGCGLVPLQFLDRYSLEKFHVVEIDAEVARVAASYFFLPSDMRLKIFIRDGRDFLGQTSEKYDLMILDAFFARSLPFPLFTRQFFALAKEGLTEDGLLVINTNGALEGKKSRLFRCLYKTLLEEFPWLCYIPVRPEEPAQVQNIIIYAFLKDGHRERVEGLNRMNLYSPPSMLDKLVTAPLPVDSASVFDDRQNLKTLDLYNPPPLE